MDESREAAQAGREAREAIAKRPRGAVFIFPPVSCVRQIGIDQPTVLPPSPERG